MNAEASSPDADAFVRTHTGLSRAPLVPEIRLSLATEVTPLWQMTEAQFGATELPPPFWAFAWPAGQGLARYILDNPTIVHGKRVLDFAAGCGIGAIAAQMAGARAVMACDIDPLALAAIRLNQKANEIEGIEILGPLDLGRPFRGVDLILAGDVCYQQTMSAAVTRWLQLNRAAGTRVLLADPGRAWVPEGGLELLRNYEVPTSKELEDRESRTVAVWDMKALD